MPILYVNLKEQKSLIGEPYSSLIKKIKGLKGRLDGEQIELRIVKKKGESFSDGFYIDDCYTKNPRILFEFVKVSKGSTESNDIFFVRMSYIYERGDCCDLEYYVQKIRSLKEHAPYFYISNVSHLEVSSRIDDDLRFQFDVIVPDFSKIQDVCCALLNQLIAVFSFDD